MLSLWVVVSEVSVEDEEVVVSEVVVVSVVDELEAELVVEVTLAEPGRERRISSVERKSAKP